MFRHIVALSLFTAALMAVPASSALLVDNSPIETCVTFPTDITLSSGTCESDSWVHVRYNEMVVCTKVDGDCVDDSNAEFLKSSQA